MFSRKIYIFVVCCFCLTLQISLASGSFLDWIWPNRNVDVYGSSLQTQNLPNIKFELSETDEKFIEDSSRLVGKKLSKADFCQQRVILNLKSSCNSLTDEQLRKLSIDLYNCQLQAESRPSHECSESIPLEECTSSMSADEWSSYNQIHGQAKQLCLSIRQDQFRGLTEMTINKLVSSTHQHLDLMERLQGSQKLLEKATLSSLDEITDSHLKLLDQQQEILKMAEFQRHNSEANMREILKEKSLLKIGNNELNSFILSLKQKIQEGLSGVQSQNQETKEAHASLLSDLEQLNLISTRIVSKLDAITEEISERGEENYALLETSKKQIEQIAEVVEEVFDFVLKLKKELNDKFLWVETYLGEDNAMEKLAIIVIHIGVLMIGMLCLVFVGADYVSRYLFLGLIGVNMTFNLTKVYDLNVGVLMKTIAALLLGNIFTKIYSKYNLKKVFHTGILKIKSKMGKIHGSHDLSGRHSDVRFASATSIPASNKREDLNLSNGHHSVDRHRYHAISHSHDYTTPSFPTRRESVSREGSHSSVSSRRSQNFHQCSAVTLKGSQCTLSSSNPSGLCAVHSRTSRDRER